MPVQTHDIAVVMNSTNRLQFFVVGAHTGQIYTCELINGPQVDWRGGPWWFMGGPQDTLQLAAARNTDGLLELFALKADGRVWHNKQTNAASYDNWGQWSDIGAVDWKQIIIGTNADGRLEAFALVDGGQAVHIWQESPSGTWSASAFFNRTGWKALAVGRNADGRMELFAIGPDHAGYHLWQLAPNSGWSDWSPLGGASWQTLTVISNQDGRLELFILAGGDALHMWQTPLTGDPCQPYLDALHAAQQHLIAVLNDPNRTPDEVKAAKQAVTNAENGLNACRGNPPFAAWSGPASFGAHDLRFMQVASNADGRLELFALGGDTSIYHIWMTAVNNGWASQWRNLNVTAQQFVVALDEKGRLLVAYLRTDGIVYLLAQSVPNNGWIVPHYPSFSSLTDPEPKPTVTLTANHKEINRGGSTTLTWTSDWATQLSIDQGIGSVSPNGSRAVSPISDTVYTITASGRGGTATDFQHIKVDQPPPPPLPDLVANQSWIEPSPFPRSDQSITVFSTYANAGLAASGTCTVRFELDNGVSSVDINVAALNPGQANTVRWNIGTLNPGDHWVYVYVDRYNTVAESNENNNVGYVGFIVS
ncbi:MAG TPA: CARDB domain-containing protein [Nitrospiraceae bacterium]|nr:CARDB domain-containing protein [Nitrospiraceae bacterium]